MRATNKSKAISDSKNSIRFLKTTLKKMNVQFAKLSLCLGAVLIAVGWWLPDRDLFLGLGLLLLILPMFCLVKKMNKSNWNIAIVFGIGAIAAMGILQMITRVELAVNAPYSFKAYIRAPLVEEAFKPFGFLILAWLKRLNWISTWRIGFLTGFFSGILFGWMENYLYPAVAERFVTSIIHGMSTGVIGVSVHRSLCTKGKWKLIVLISAYTVVVLLHLLLNLL